MHKYACQTSSVQRPSSRHSPLVRAVTLDKGHTSTDQKHRVYASSQLEVSTAFSIHSLQGGFCSAFGATFQGSFWEALSLYIRSQKHISYRSIITKCHTSLYSHVFQILKKDGWSRYHSVPRNHKIRVLFIAILFANHEVASLIQCPGKLKIFPKDDWEKSSKRDGAKTRNCKNKCKRI